MIAVKNICKEECAFGAVGNYCNCQMKALYPFFETFILLGLLEEAPRRNMRRHLSPLDTFL